MTMLVEVRAKWCDILVNLLECPICYEIPKTHIYQCLSGHHICYNCRNNLIRCPTCQRCFGTSRNYLAEALSDTLEDIKISLMYPTHHINRHVRENKICVYTQTHEISKASIATQTMSILLHKNEVTQTEELPISKNAEVNTKDKQIIGKRKKKHLSYPRNIKGSYHCCIGSCMTSLSYGDLIKHIKYSHADAFYKLQGHKGIFKKNLQLQYIIPKDYNFALFIRNMGLFFLNIKILPTGDLTGAVYVANSASASKHFTSTLVIGEGEKATIYSGVVKSCRDLSKQTMDSCLYKKHVEMDQILVNNDKFNSSVTIKRFYRQTKKP